MISRLFTVIAMLMSTVFAILYFRELMADKTLEKTPSEDVVEHEQKLLKDSRCPQWLANILHELSVV
jgi:hypothetical protein